MSIRSIIVVIGVFFYQGNTVAQSIESSHKTDSLLKVLENHPTEDTLKSEILAGIGSNYTSQSDYPRAIHYKTQAANLSVQLDNKIQCMRIWSSLGADYTAIANYPKALEYHLKALRMAEQLNLKSGISSNLNFIGRVYMFIGDYPKALEYYQRALAISEETKLTVSIARQHRNIGNTYCKMGNYPLALDHLQRSQQLFESLGNTEGESIGLGVIGFVYYHLKEYDKALVYLNKAINLNRKHDMKRQESINLQHIGKTYRDAPDEVLQKQGIKPSDRFTKALEYLVAAQQLSKKIGDPGTEKTAWEDISLTYEKQADFANAFSAYKQYILLRDSVEGLEIKNQLAIQELQFEFNQKETKLLYEQQLNSEKLRQQELLVSKQQQDLNIKQQLLIVSKQEKDLQHLAYLKTQAELRQQQIAGEKQLSLTAQKDAELKLLTKEQTLHKTQLELTNNTLKARENQRNAFLVGSILMLFLAGAIAMGLIRTSQEKKKSEELLLNILPSEVAKELKQTGGAAAKQYNNVTVLFTDFVNFTGISEQLSPTQLVAIIHANFTVFDSIIEKHGLEKIKTIGDAYLAVCGLPHETADHAHRVVQAALAIQKHMQESGGAFQIRIGINSGPVVAGIVGVKKYAYDIWGDTVNTAARMEEHSEAGKINISGSTYELIQQEFDCTYRGKIQAKNKGEVDMYFVNRNLGVG